MSKWLKAARSARASKPDSELSYACANSAVSTNSPPERPIGTNGTIGRGIDGLIRDAHPAAVPDLSDPEDIQVWLDERSAIRECSGIVRVVADKLAFSELLWIWHAANPVERTPGQCAACGTAFDPPVMSLPDGAAVCDTPDHACLTAYGNGRRTEAVTALGSMGIVPPAWWEL